MDQKSQFLEGVSKITQFFDDIENQRNENEDEYTSKAKGQVVYVIDYFDAKTTNLSVTHVRLNKDKNFKAVTSGSYATYQTPFVIDVPFEVDSEEWEGSPLIETKELKPGDNVYIYFDCDGDAYGTKVVGVFSRELTPNEIERLRQLDEDKNDGDYIMILEKSTTVLQLE